MENTLEMRWFVRGIPPAVVQRWFKFECPGKFADELEIRKDWYAYLQQDDLEQLIRFSSRSLNYEEINLKLRQGNLELKIRQQEFGTYQFGHLKHSDNCEGNVEQWSKFDRYEPRNFSSTKNFGKTAWIGINKERRQKIEQGVKSELTWLTVDGNCVAEVDENSWNQISSSSNNKHCWWTIAFEMAQNDRRSDSYFKEVVERACQAYSGPKLSASNSYGYSRWLLELEADVSIPNGR